MGYSTTYTLSTTKDIRNLVSNGCPNIHFLELDRLLQKLDNEDLDVLYDILEETYEAGEEESCGYTTARYEADRERI